MKKFEKLSRAEMKNVLGGATPVPFSGSLGTSCTADCGAGFSVTCTGTDCQAIDYDGCDAAGKNGGDTKNCNSVLPL